MQRIKTALCLVALVGLASAIPAAEAVKLASDSYSGYFVSNKFEPHAALSFVALDNQPQFDRTFGAGFVMHDKSHRLPPNAFESLLVIGAIHRGFAVWDYKVEGVTVTAGVVELRYTTTVTPSATATFACPLIVSIPKGAYQSVRFVENGKLVRQLAVGGGARPSAL